MDPFRWNGLDRSIVAIDDWCVSEQKQIASGDVKQFANWKMAIEIVDLPISSMVIFHSYVKLPEGSQSDSYLDDATWREKNGILDHKKDIS